MREYRVRWEIDVSAESPIDAAREARLIQEKPDSIAHVYEVAKAEDAHDGDWVYSIEIDLDKIDRKLDQ